MSPDSRPPEMTGTPRRRDAFWVLLLLGGATLIAVALDPYASLTSQAMVYVLAVVVASYALTRRAAVLSAVAAVTLLNFLFIPPRFTFQVDAQENLAALFAMLAVALVVSHLGTALRRESDLARLSERRARELQALATELAGCEGASQARLQAQRFLGLAFPGPCVVAVLVDGALNLPAESVPTVGDGMAACIREGTTLGPGTGRWPGLHAWYIPLKAQDHISGAACVQNVSAQDHAGREHAQAICSLLGQALWRLSLARSAEAAQAQSQWHKAQNTLLAAISHDFRTPLASIMGAASALHTQRDKLPLAEQDRLAKSILTESQHLADLTENTLQLARLESAGQLDLDWQSIEEIVGAVLARVRTRDTAGRISSSVPARLPLIKADPVLLTQLLENLLDNALKYSTNKVDLVVSLAQQSIDVAVHDRGTGVPAGQELTIFEPYRRGDRSEQRGTGLGLALCRAIARAHGAELTVASRAGGGASFTLKLPVEAIQPHSEAA